MSETRDLLIEIGTEELPPRALSSLANNFADQILYGLKAAYAAERSGDISVYFSPRRFAVLIEKLYTSTITGGEKQLGPPVETAFDKDGNPTKVAIGFAKKHGVNIDDLKRIDTDKGERVYCEFAETEQPVSGLIPDIINQALGKLPIPRRMRWGNYPTEFVRPVHWAVVLFGDEVIECNILGVHSGRHTRGHRFHFTDPVALKSADEYVQTLKQHKVWVNDATHGLQKEISRQASKLADEIDGDPLNSDAESDLVAEIAALVEWPVAIRGDFDPDFLVLPEEILIATLEYQQRYFPIRDRKTGKLAPSFITIANIESRDEKQVRQGNERVIIPRLSDAMFFWKTDRTRSLESRIPELDGITFQKKLGSLGDKTRHVAQLAATIAEQLDMDPALASRAAQLCRCDLVTNLVGEFPELQGTIGRYLAREDGEPAEVATAIEELYLPRFAGDRLPATKTGQVLALADKLDTLAGIFGIGMQPTGDKDPFALRRAALGIVRILVEQRLPFSVATLVDAAYEVQDTTIAEAQTDVQLFILERARGYFLEQGHAVTAIEAVLQPFGGSSPLYTLPEIIREGSEFISTQEGRSLAEANKRITNILRKSGFAVPVAGAKPETLAQKPDEKLFSENEEQEFWRKLQEIGQKSLQLKNQEKFAEALRILTGLAGPTASFFDNVMVNVDDEKIRDNRITLLQFARVYMNQVADLALMAQ